MRTDDSTLQAVRAHLEEYLQQQGIDTRRNFRCLNPEHEDKNPSMSYDRNNLRVKCFSCGATYDLLDLVGMEKNLHTFLEQLKAAADMFGERLDEERPAPRPSQPVAQEEPDFHTKQMAIAAEIEKAAEQIRSPRALAYLRARGISPETAERFHLGYNPRFFAGDGKTWEAIIIPTGPFNYTARNMDGSADPKERYRRRGPARPFNVDALRNSETPLHVVEGEFDALAVIEAGGNAVALGSTANWQRVPELLQQGGVFLGLLIISLDNDEAGRDAAANMERALFKLRMEQPEKFKAMKVSVVNISGSCKDPNEAWVKDPEQLKAALGQKVSDDVRKEYDLEHSAREYLQSFFNGINDRFQTPPISTGFSFLDSVLDGGLYAKELVTLPAISGLGKTTFAIQLAENIAAQGKDVLYLTMEMDAEELIAKALSRHTFLLACDKDMPTSYAKTMRGITDTTRWKEYSEDELGLIMEAADTYAKRAAGLYFHTGLGEVTPKRVRQLVEEHERVRGTVPVLFVDYLQILMPEDPHATDKQNMDRAALEMKRIARDFQTPVIVVSSINRANYYEAINMAAIKESGAIEYGSDVILGLQLFKAGTDEAKKAAKEWEDEQSRKDPRKVEAVVLKNRHGSKGDRIHFNFYTKFNLFEETVHDPREL